MTKKHLILSNKNKLFILREVKNDSIYAISEEERLITNYIKLFDGYFKDGIDKSEYQIDIIRGKNQVDYYLERYQDCLLYIRGMNNALTLTEWEWNYYSPFFKELYEKAKDTIVNLEVFHTIYDPCGISSNMKDLSNEFYQISQSLDEFIGNIPIEFIKQELLMEPIKAHKFNKILDEMGYWYRQVLDEGK